MTGVLSKTKRKAPLRREIDEELQVHIDRYMKTIEYGDYFFYTMAPLLTKLGVVARGTISPSYTFKGRLCRHED